MKLTKMDTKSISLFCDLSMAIMTKNVDYRTPRGVSVTYHGDNIEADIVFEYEEARYALFVIFNGLIYAYADTRLSWTFKDINKAKVQKIVKKYMDRPIVDYLKNSSIPAEECYGG